MPYVDSTVLVQFVDSKGELWSDTAFSTFWKDIFDELMSIFAEMALSLPCGGLRGFGEPCPGCSPLGISQWWMGLYVQSQGRLIDCVLQRECRDVRAHVFT